MTTKIKTGMASLYLVAFTTLLMGILTMSFARVMLSETKESSNSDLSQSAYDSALAGIEDAKTVIVMYNACLGNKEQEFNGVSCDDIKERMEKKGFEEGSCDVISAILNRAGGEVEIKDNDNGLNQAYTCVTIANDSADYRSVLNENIAARTIPVMVTNDDYDDIVAFELQWYSNALDENRINGPAGYMYSSDLDGDFISFKPKNVATDDLPIISFEIFQTDKEGFKMHELDLNNETNTGTDHASIVLSPYDKQEHDTHGTFIPAEDLLNVSNKNNQVVFKSSEDSITPKLVSCGYKDGFRCRTTIALPATYGRTTTSYPKETRAEDTFIIRVSLPYNTPSTDFSITPCKTIVDNHCGEYAKWTGRQFIVDSTGRASTLYRRVTARIDAINTVFIYPDYAIQATGNDATVEKDFWVTENCWATDGDGNSTACANNGNTH